MRRLIEQTACEHGEFEEHCDHKGHFVCWEPTCPGGSSRVLTVDYEAGADMVNTILANLLSRSPDTIILDVAAAEMIVDAALGGGL